MDHLLSIFKIGANKNLQRAISKEFKLGLITRLERDVLNNRIQIPNRSVYGEVAISLNRRSYHHLVVKLFDFVKEKLCLGSRLIWKQTEQH